jgi:hypothetical protein
MRPVSHCATYLALLFASIIVLAAKAEAGPSHQRAVDRSTSYSPDQRFWRFAKSDGSCAVYVHRRTGQRRTFCDE